MLRGLEEILSCEKNKGRKAQGQRRYNLKESASSAFHGKERDSWTHSTSQDRLPS
jgi:hypothetical protein